MASSLNVFARRIFPLALIATALTVGAGCARDTTSGPTIGPTRSFDRPPAAQRDPALAIVPRHGAIIAVGEFRDPARPTVPWNDIGRGMTDVFVRTLLSEGGWDVRIDPPFGAEVERALRTSFSQRRSRLRGLQEERADVRYVIVGRVTDFVHTGTISSELQRVRGFQRRNEAVVAMQLDLVDLVEAEVIATDHVIGIGRIRTRDAEAVYEHLSIDSYLFWSTPLGRASAQAIREAFNVIDHALAPVSGALRIEERLSDRTVQVGSRSQVPIRSGVYYVYVKGPGGGSARPVYDPATGRAIEVRISSGGRRTVRGLMLGVPPIEVDLRGAKLKPTPPEPLEVASHRR